MWLGEEGQGEVAEEQRAGESWVHEEDDDEEEDPRWQSSSDKFSDQVETSCWRSLILSSTLSRAENTSSPANSRPTWEKKKQP